MRSAAAETSEQMDIAENTSARSAACLAVGSERHTDVLLHAIRVTTRRTRPATIRFVTVTNSVQPINVPGISTSSGTKSIRTIRAFIRAPFSY